MKPEIINTNIRNYLQLSQFTTAEDIDRILRLGLIATNAAQFLDKVAYSVGADGVFILNEFYRNFLGMFDLVSVEVTAFLMMIRFSTQITPNGQDGVQLCYTLRPHGRYHIVLSKLTASFDTTSISVIKEYT